jgi:hypothetical protein
MIKCEKCGVEFVAHGVQRYPGDTDPPASHIAYAVILGLAGIVLRHHGTLRFSDGHVRCGDSRYLRYPVIALGDSRSQKNM